MNYAMKKEREGVCMWGGREEIKLVMHWILSRKSL